MDSQILSWIVFLPLAGIPIILLLPKDKPDYIRWAALGVAAADFLLSLYLPAQFDSSPSASLRTSNPGMQFSAAVPWIESLGIYYRVGADGISLFLVLLTTFLSVLVIYSTFNSITEKVRGFYISYLLLQTGMLGVFVALDLFLFYVFWEAMLVPMYFLIGIWGGPRKIYATIKFVLFTMFGSLLMLVAILALYFFNQAETGKWSFNLFDFYQLGLPPNLQIWLFAAFALAFAIKVPMFPFHTWLPDAHVEAPTAGSVILAGVLLKMGTYGFLRFLFPIFPNATFQFIPLLSVLSIIGIIYGALMAMVQKDIKSLVAFSSVSHLGFVTLGLLAMNIQGWQGGMLQMLNHGISTGALFLLVGMIYERRHTRRIDDFGGLTKVVPVFAVFFMIITLSSIGLPGTNGFVGEFLILVGAFRSNPVYAAFATTGVILSAVYMLWMFQRVMFGEVKNQANAGLTDLTWAEKAVLAPLVVFVFWIGIYPNSFLRRMEGSLNNLLNQVNRRETVLRSLPHQSWAEFLAAGRARQNRASSNVP